MFLSLFSFSSRNLSEFSRFSLRGQLHRPEDTKYNVLHLANCHNQFHHRKFFEWVRFLWLIHLDRLINYSYSFERQPATRIFKNKNRCFPEQGNVSHHTKKKLDRHTQKTLLEKDLTYSSIFKVYFYGEFLLPQRHLLLLLKTDAEAAVGKCSWT